jgi:hypothetical protein
MAKKCPVCGKPATGKFCSNCGASLAGPLECGKCGNEIPAGGRFCNMCGTPVTSGEKATAMPGLAGSGGAATPSKANTTAILGALAALALLVVVLLVVIPRLRQPEPAPATPPFARPVGGTAGNPAAIDLDTIAPEQAAYQLFARVMESVSEGDSVAARRFAPMAIQAYGLVPGLDLDGHYHLALLHLVNNDPAGARRTAGVMLEQVPTHLFGLYTAAQSEQAMGNQEAARELYRQFLANYDAEIGVDRFEYTEHERVLPAMRDDAERILGGVPP